MLNQQYLIFLQFVIKCSSILWAIGFLMCSLASWYNSLYFKPMWNQAEKLMTSHFVVVGSFILTTSKLVYTGSHPSRNSINWSLLTPTPTPTPTPRRSTRARVLNIRFSSEEFDLTRDWRKILGPMFTPLRLLFFNYGSRWEEEVTLEITTSKLINCVSDLTLYSTQWVWNLKSYWLFFTLSWYNCGVKY